MVRFLLSFFLLAAGLLILWSDGSALGVVLAIMGLVGMVLHGGALKNEG